LRVTAAASFEVMTGMVTTEEYTGANGSWCPEAVDEDPTGRWPLPTR